MSDEPTPSDEGKDPAAEVLERHRERKTGRGQYEREGKKRGPYNKGGQPPGAAPAPLPAPVFTPENTAPIVEVPFLVWSVVEDVDGLALSEREKRAIVPPAVAALNQSCPVPPRWVNLLLVLLGLVGVVGLKLVWLRALRKEQARARKAGGTGPGSGPTPEPPAAGPAAARRIPPPAPLENPPGAAELGVFAQRPTPTV